MLLSALWMCRHVWSCFDCHNRARVSHGLPLFTRTLSEIPQYLIVYRPFIGARYGGWTARPSISWRPSASSGSTFAQGGLSLHFLVCASTILFLMSLNLLYSSIVAKYSRLSHLSNVSIMVASAASDRLISVSIVSRWYHFTLRPRLQILQSKAYRYLMSSRSSRMFSFVTRVTCTGGFGVF